MTSIHPSQFPKRADGTRFDFEFVEDFFLVHTHDGEPICTCPTPEHAKMIVAALEFQARDGETFPLEPKP